MAVSFLNWCFPVFHTLREHYHVKVKEGVDASGEWVGMRRNQILSCLRPFFIKRFTTGGSLSLRAIEREMGRISYPDFSYTWTIIHDVLILPAMLTCNPLLRLSSYSWNSVIGLSHII